MNLRNYTLFLDRDGVINKQKKNGYIESVSEFEFLPQVLDIFPLLNNYFSTILIVTNQQGVGKGLMTIEQLDEIHRHMCREIEKKGGKIHKVYYCPHLASTAPSCRKPNTGMGIEAKKDFPQIEFSKSVMVGDSESDIEFAINLGMPAVRILNGLNEVQTAADFSFANLAEFAENLR